MLDLHFTTIILSELLLVSTNRLPLKSSKNAIVVVVVVVAAVVVVGLGGLCGGRRFACHGTYVEDRGQFVELVLSF